MQQSSGQTGAEMNPSYSDSVYFGKNGKDLIFTFLWWISLDFIIQVCCQLLHLFFMFIQELVRDAIKASTEQVKRVRHWDVYSTARASSAAFVVSSPRVNASLIVQCDV